MRVYTFGDGQSEGSSAQLEHLGRKAAGLARLCALGLPVPPGFTLPTTLCAEWSRDPTALDRIWPEVRRGLAWLAELAGRQLGSVDQPLTLAVRSGATSAMPGVLATILNVGLNDETTAALARRTGDEGFALDCQLRFMEMYATSTLGLPAAVLDDLRAEQLGDHSGDARSAPVVALKAVRAAYRAALDAAGLGPIPDDPHAQLRGAIEGVLGSWSQPRAAQHREVNQIADVPGTAVTVQVMVFGNLDRQSGAGVAISRDPNTGEAVLFGEFLPCAQGEAVVGGRRTPRLLRHALPQPGHPPTMQSLMPGAFRDLVSAMRGLEQAVGEVQEVEFTVESGRLWLLQTRRAERSARAAVRVAAEMAEEGLLAPDDALLRVDPERIALLLNPNVDVRAGCSVVAQGLPASPGAVSGGVVFSADEAVRRAADGQTVILVRPETSTEELVGIRAAAGVLTMRGGMTSHAALIARGLGRCCVTACSDIKVDDRAGTLLLLRTGQCLGEGDLITLNGTSGEVLLGQVATQPAERPAAYRRLMRWADTRRRLSVRVSADEVADARVALERGADGIGLCRTEQMFSHTDRVSLVREMILAFDRLGRLDAVQRILPVLRADFRALFAVAANRPVAIRLLDRPLHEMMPDVAADLTDVAERLHVSTRSLFDRAQRLKAHNPQLGHRGCRIGMTFPEVYDVQLQALFEAYAESAVGVELQIVLPLVTAVEEVRRLRQRIDATAAEVAGARGRAPFEYVVGAMIESPRACLIAGDLAEVADFFLFGTNDLTSATFCVHLDDAGRFLPAYLAEGVLPHDPFSRLDATVVRLIRIAIEEGRRRRPGLSCGLAGVHAGNPQTVEICEALGLDFVSVVPDRVPVVRLAAAQAVVKGDRNQ